MKQTELDIALQAIDRILEDIVRRNLVIGHTLRVPKTICIEYDRWFALLTIEKLPGEPD